MHDEFFAIIKGNGFAATFRISNEMMEHVHRNVFTCFGII
jgi:hypothetical protein